MNTLNGWITKASRTWWLFAIIAILNFGSFRLLFALEDQFESITGVPVFDTQNDLTPAILIEQLPLYEGEARAAYWRFALFDFVFPFVAALFLAVLWAFFVRATHPQIGRPLERRHLPLFVFFTTLFDWLENIALLTLVTSGTSTPDWIVIAALLFKRLKLTALGLTSLLTVVLLVLALLSWGYHFWQKRTVRKEFERG